MKRLFILLLASLATILFVHCGGDESTAPADDTGGNGETENEFECLKNVDCKDGKLCVNFKCTEIPEGAKEEDCKCTEAGSQVCGADGKTYADECTAKCFNIEVNHEGKCTSKDTGKDAETSDGSQGDGGKKDSGTGDGSEGEGEDTESPDVEGDTGGTDSGDTDGGEPPVCVDNDEDGYGPGCELGDDCNDEKKEISPAAHELCDGIDNNCNDAIDEGFNVGGTCTAGVGACQTTGTLSCAADHLSAECNAVPGTPTQELCDGVDNDCDGVTDNGFDIGVECTVGKGICENKGVKTCTADGTTTECTGTPKDPDSQGEKCGSTGGGDGLDNDCDGEVDEICVCTPGEKKDCGSDVGICRKGQQECVGGIWSSCLGGTSAQTELCGDSLDNDCDGDTDEGFGIGDPCTVGKGVCERTGTKVCSADKQSSECNATPGQPQEEKCNGLDDNCDGTVDETGCALNCTQINALPSKYAWWQLDEPDTNAAILDSTPNGHHGELGLVKRTASGYCNRAIDCLNNQGGSFVELENDMPATITMMAMIKSTADRARGTILEKAYTVGQGWVTKTIVYRLYIEQQGPSTTRICFQYVDTASLCSSYTFTKNQWYLVKVAVKEEAPGYFKRSLYVNTDVVKMDIVEKSIKDSKGTLTIGNNLSYDGIGSEGGDDPFTGIIDEVTIYSE